MNLETNSLFTALEAWLVRDSRVNSAVLFGSMAARAHADSYGRSSDLDLHVISPEPRSLEAIDWSHEFPGHGYYFQAVRPATGGMRKVTALFVAGQIDLVIVPRASARLARAILRWQLHRRSRSAENALNEMATCLQTGYRFLKGEDDWAAFYAEVSATMPGVRVSDVEACRLADAFLTDVLWVCQKLDRGELIAAQHALHRQLSEVNLRLVRELRLREKLPLPSFGLGRRIESSARPEELAWVTLSARLHADELRHAAAQALIGLKGLMSRLVPSWSISPEMAEVLSSHTAAPSRLHAE